MFATLRRHQKWLWYVISILTIISFVWFFSPRSSRGVGRGGWRENDVVGSIYGRAVHRDEYLQAAREARLRYFLSYRQWPDEDEMARQLGILDREIRNRLMLIEKLKQLDVQVGVTAAAQWIADVFQDPQRHAFNQDFYDQFVKQTLPAKIGMQPRGFEEFVRHEVGVQHLLSVFGVPGKLVTPQEAEALYRRENEQVDTKVILISASNFLAQVSLDPAAIATFYTNQQAAYRVPERVQVSYVKFDATNFLAAVDEKLAKQDTNTLSQFIDKEYQQRGPDSFKGPAGEPLSPEQAKQRIRDEIRHEQGRVEAQKKATEFMEQLFELKPATPDNLEKLAAATANQVSVSQPFTQSEQPAGLDMPEGFARSVFKLTFEEPFLDAPVLTRDAVYVVALKSRQPSAQPPLEEVLERVNADYLKLQARILANQAGQELQRTLSGAMDAGKTFETAAAENNAQIVDLAPFSQKTQILPELSGQADTGAIKNVAFTLTPGQLSSYNQAREGGFMLYLEKRVPVTDSQVQTALPEYMKTLRQSRGYDAFSEWLRKELEVAHITGLPGEKKTAP